MEAKGIDFAAIPQTAISGDNKHRATFFREMPKSGGFVSRLSSWL
jgi:hypothetical protein